MAGVLEQGWVLAAIGAVLAVLVGAVLVVRTSRRRVRVGAPGAAPAEPAVAVESQPVPEPPVVPVEPMTWAVPEPASLPEPPSAPEQPVDVGADSALASLDSGRLAAGLPQIPARRVVLPAPRKPIDDAAPGPEPPYPGAAHAMPDGSAPSAEFSIKGHAGSKRYYTEESPCFARTIAQVWFRTTQDAEAAGFRSSGRP